jgi:hypothetical protein
MKTGLRSLIALLIVLGVGDLVMVPFMIGAYHRTAGTPPMPAIVLGAILGVATLVSIIGVTRGRRWGYLVAMICRILDTVSMALGIVAGPGVGFAIVGGFGVVLSIAAIVLLVRLNPRRALRGAASRT